MRATSGFRCFAAALCAVLLWTPAWASPPAVQAVWVSRHVHFVYQGFTTLYSCEGLRDEIQDMLVKLGARHLQIISDPCIRPGAPDPFPGVRVRMQVLVPAAANTPAAKRLAAHWHKVVVSGEGADLNQGGKCELIAQFRHTFLPLFTTRHIDIRADCIPHQVTMSSYLSAEVLVPQHSPPAHR